ncbi:S8 family serine peptidase [Paenibacillus tarimensis]|uniref:S8 family serine peptidase n=1 Tax=Paenibacillus tarimensis TaxID=416012 RepID=UPI001F289569|nr:S8 family serine peptidase [Paenibacillus tarimensis]MCF2945804.1 S8 family serine peptidase [Paenibacillus tarimensis]
MKKWMIFVLSAVVLFNLSLPPSLSAMQHYVTEYMVVFEQEEGLPANYRAIVHNAGGVIEKEYSKLGAVKASSMNPGFLPAIKKHPAVASAGIPGIIRPEQLEYIEMDSPTAVEAHGGHDLYETYQWDIKQVTGNGASWEMRGGTGQPVDGQPVVIAVVDTGIDYTHPDLSGNYLYGKSFVDNEPSARDYSGHGTMVAGMIAANGRVMGVGPDLKLASYRVFGQLNSASTFEIAEAVMTAADDQVDVINLSLGGYIWVKNPEQNEKDNRAELKMFRRAVKYAIKKGVVVVNSAGNLGADVSDPNELTRLLYGEDASGKTYRNPDHKDMIVVSSGTLGLQLASYSNYGRNVIDVMAPGGERNPGVSCVSTSLNGRYGQAFGTSLAAPKVSALAGIIIARQGKKTLKPGEVAKIIAKSSKDLFGKGKDEFSGYGLIDAVSALSRSDA